MLLLHLTGDGVEVTPDHECVGELENPDMLQVLACWHDEEGWLPTNRCALSAYTGSVVYDVEDTSSQGARRIEYMLGEPMEACEREEIKLGFAVTGMEGWGGLFVTSNARYTQEDLCQVEEPVENSPHEARDWLVARMNGSLDEALEAWGQYVQADVIEHCRERFERTSGTLAERIEQFPFNSPDGRSELFVSDVLHFPRAKRGKIEAMRSATFRMCELDLVWVLRDEKWELVGINDSSAFSSTLPFGEGLIDITTSICSDLNHDGSPEIWISSGYETMGGTSLVDTARIEPGKPGSGELYVRYTGD